MNLMIRFTGFALVIIFCCLILGNHGADVEKLLSAMSLESKIGQMTQMDIYFFSTDAVVNYTFMREYIHQYQIGSILSSPFILGPVNGTTGWTAQQWRELNRKILEFSRETASGIPIVYGIDSIHGATFVKDSALMPQSINLAATFNETHAYIIGQVTSKDTRSAGIAWISAPVLGLGLQPLWARFPETYGEDPYLAAVMGGAAIRGLQHLSGDGSLPKMTAASMKHFIAYSIPVDGHDRSPVQLPDRILKQLYLPSFQAAIDAGVLTSVESYSEVGGVPIVTSKEYLKTLLRKQMNFTGFMVTDYEEIENVHNWHKVTATQREAVKLVMQDTTVDMSMVPLDSSFYHYLLDLVQNGEVNESRVDESVRRILEVKNRLGLLESDYQIEVNDPIINTVGQESDWDLSLNAARESITLVKNDGILPLDPLNPELKQIVVTGPTCNSSSSLSGGWSIHWQGIYYEWEQSKKVTIYQGIEKIFAGNIKYIPGPLLNATNLAGLNMTQILTDVSTADVVIVCLGEGSYAEKRGDIDNLALPLGQIEYVTALATVAKKIVLVMAAGRPRLIHDAVIASNAVLLSYLPGPLGGQAIAEILFGQTIPSGRLPFTYPRYPATSIYPYHHKPSDQCTVATGAHTAAYIPCEVEWPFGTGLSYTTFQYSDFQLSQTVIDEQSELTVTVTITNTGTYPAKHSVLLFLYDLYRRVTPEYKLLKRFTKIDLLPQQSETVKFVLNAIPDLQSIGVEGYYLLEAGQYWIGMSPAADCRAGIDTIQTNDTTSQDELMCLPFNLTLSDRYHPICQQACRLWSGSEGICGTIVESSECMATCQSQSWHWEYVNCLYEYYQETTCTDPRSMQCYDAFGFTQPLITDDANSVTSGDYSLLFVMIISGGTSLATLILGIVCGYCYLKYRIVANNLSELEDEKVKDHDCDADERSALI